ncbi:MAG: hypothetical protein WAW57_15355 [Lutibacter sp.]
MKNLYDKLSNDNKSKLEETKLKYPLLYERITESLKSKSYSIEVPVLVASELFSEIYDLTPFDLMKYYELFDNE